MVPQKLRELVQKIFVLDPENRAKIPEIKASDFFSEFDFSVSMMDRFNNDFAPFVPNEALFSEKADRESEMEKV
jgi:serine/threonine protein kinase